MDVKGKEPINLAKGVFPVTAGAVSPQVLVGANSGQTWKVMKAPPKESLTTNAVAASEAPVRVSRTIIGGGSSTRVVTRDHNSSIAYDPREHRFVNAASAPQSFSDKGAEKVNATKETVVSERTGQSVAQSRTEVRSAANVRVPASSARAATPPTRAMTPPPAPRASYSGGGWGAGAASRGSSGSSRTFSAPSVGASHPAPSGGGRPH